MDRDRTSTLDNMCELIVDCPHFTPEWTDSGYIVIRNQNIRDGKLDLSEKSYTHRDDFERRIKRAKPKTGDIIFTREAPIGEVCMIPKNLECCVGQRQVLLRPKREVDGRYLFFALRSAYVRHQIFWSEGTGSTVSNVRIPILKELRIPRLSNEKAIGDLLGALDDKIDLNRRMNETLEAMARAIFKDWFVDFGPVRAKAEGCPPYLAPDLWVLFPGALNDEDKPVGWEEISIAEMIEIIGGGTPKTSVAEFWGGSIPWFSVVDAPSLSDVFVIDTEKHITESGLKNSSTQIISKGKTIITARGTVGKLAYVAVPMAMNQSCYAIVGKPPLSSYFTYFMLKGAVQGLQANTHGSVFDTITRSTFSSVDGIRPNDRLIQIFDEVAGPLMARILSNLQESKTLAHLRDILLPKLISREIHFRDADKIVEAIA